MEESPSPKELFWRALELPPDERAAFLHRECGADQALRAKVDELLASHDGAPRFMASPTAHGSEVPDGRHQLRGSDVASLIEGPGTRIGPYKILQLIGEGGFGSVFMAEQTEPVKRRIALKIIKLGMDTRQVIARFEAERQALAMMEHPNIARVIDAGATKTGRPYFAMELVRGEPITEYCNRNNLGIEDRLELFAQVCHAIQHAHTKGIIHRDVKPSNVLVTSTDGKPIPKMIDFGIAKATRARLTEKTLFTEHRQLIGTPEYMSPEQAEMNTSDIDTRSDIYSLGVLLYELLTGAPPFDPKRLRSAAFAEIQRIIREEDVPTPSARLSTLCTQSGVAARRKIELTQLSRMLRGDLDWIVMKCLEKDRTRRYETASALAQDVQCHLSGDAVHAAPPSAAYRLRKFIRRHKAGVVAAFTVAVALMLGVVGTTAGMIRAHTEKQRALKAEADAEARAAELEKMTTFQNNQLSQIDVALMGVRLRQAILRERENRLKDSGAESDDIEAALGALEGSLAGVNFTNIALENLDENIFQRSLAAIGEQFATLPKLRARLLQTVADTMRELGLLDGAKSPQDDALALRLQVLGDEHPDTLESLANMAVLLRAMGRINEAEPYHRQALAGFRRGFGDMHLDTLTVISNLGVLLQSMGKHEEAETYLREALEARRRILGNDHPDTLVSLNLMGVLRHSEGRFAEAEVYFREALRMRRRVHGNDHPRTLTAINNLGWLLYEQRNMAEAELLWREGLEGRRRVLGEDHPETLTAINALGVLYYGQNNYSTAEDYFRKALEGKIEMLGRDHPDTLLTIGHLCNLHKSQHQLAEAEPYCREALERRRRLLGDNHADTLHSIGSMGHLLIAQGKLAEAETLLVAAMNTAESKLAPSQKEIHRLLQIMTRLYQVWNTEQPGMGYAAKVAAFKARLSAWESNHQLKKSRNTAHAPAPKGQ